MNRIFVQNNMVLNSILIFIIVYGIIHMFKPAIIYGQSGELRQFGINQKHKTIFPAWLISIVVAILSYLAIRFYTVLPFIRNRIYT